MKSLSHSHQYGFRAIATLFLALFPALHTAQAADLWQAQSIDQIITDRFFDGDPGNNNAEGNYDPTGRRGTSVHGGDFKGIEQKLDYIQALGATAIWISPVILNARGEFHGCAGRDFYKVAPHWGTLAELAGQHNGYRPPFGKSENCRLFNASPC